MIDPKEKVPVLYLPLEENFGDHTLDWSGWNNYGELVGPTWTDGKIGKCLSFDGFDDYVKVLHNPSLNITTELTLEAWIKPRGTGTTWQAILTKGEDAKENYELLWNIGNYFHTAWLFDVGRITKSWFYPIRIGEWNYVTLVWKAPMMYFYLDGEFKEAWDTGASYAITNTLPLRIGSEVGVPYWWNGETDEVRVYNKVLSPEEIRKHYLAKVHIYNVKRKKHLRYYPGCRIAINMEERTGTKAYDLSGFRTDGTIYGATWNYGKIGRGLLFDGTDDYVEVDYDPKFDCADVGTVEAWVKPAKIGVIMDIVNKRKDLWKVDIYTDGTVNLRGYSKGIFYNPVVGSITALTANQWAHIVAVWSKAEGFAKIYINGKLDNEVVWDKSFDTGPYSLVIGIGWDKVIYPFDGLIDEVRVYARALTPEQIKANYHYGLSLLSSYPRR